MNAEVSGFSAADLAVLERRGISPAEATRQLRTLASPPGHARLDRPCSPLDGIVVLSDERVEALVRTHAAAAARGRLTAFVPASGAATRMFKDLIAVFASEGALMPSDVRAAAASGSAEAGALLAWIDGLPRFAFRDALAAVLEARGLDLDSLRERGPWRELLAACLEPDGLDQARSPKALLLFHREDGAVRTAFEEQLAEAALLVRDAQGICRLHFTVSPEHRPLFVSLLERARGEREAGGSLHYEVSFSEQHPATDTIAAEVSGGPFRGPGGELVFRPAGHGALLRNLSELGADLVFLKNIDNVAVARLREPTTRWSRALVGMTAELSDGAAALAMRLADASDEGATADAAGFVRGSLGVAQPPQDRAGLLDLLERPLRVCGMVRNTGEPGGGPFWVRGVDGKVSAQVVESVQVDAASDGQREILRSATHFNPVFLACALRDRHGRQWPLDRFTDPDAVLVARKSAQGRDLLALELPGLWNGAMARWNTVFVEVPLEVFHPVKTVLDLLRPEHQG